MEKRPLTFASHVVKKYGKTIDNDYEPVNKFFADMSYCLSLLNGIPFAAVEELEKYEGNRDVMIHIVRRIFRICDAAKVNIVAEMERQNKEKNAVFDGLEEDVARKKEALKNNILNKSNNEVRDED
jgi:hypothetical protein